MPQRSEDANSYQQFADFRHDGTCILVVLSSIMLVLRSVIMVLISALTVLSLLPSSFSKTYNE